MTTGAAAAAAAATTGTLLARVRCCPDAPVSSKSIIGVIGHRGRRHCHLTVAGIRRARHRGNRLGSRSAGKRGCRNHPSKRSLETAPPAHSWQLGSVLQPGRQTPWACLGSQKGEGEQPRAIDGLSPRRFYAPPAATLARMTRGLLVFSIAHIRKPLLLDYERHTGNHFSVSYRSLLLPLRWRSCRGKDFLAMR